MGLWSARAIGAKALYRNRTVVSCGRRLLLMTGQELATAVQHQLPIVIIVVNNGMYGTIPHAPGARVSARVHGTTLVNRICRLRACIRCARRMSNHGQFAPALERPAGGQAGVVELRLDPEAISTEATR